MYKIAFSIILTTLTTVVKHKITQLYYQSFFRSRTRNITFDIHSATSISWWEVNKRTQFCKTNVCNKNKSGIHSMPSPETSANINIIMCLLFEYSNFNFQLQAKKLSCRCHILCVTTLSLSLSCVDAATDFNIMDR